MTRTTENWNTMGIPPHIRDFTNKGINRPALPTDSFFATPEGLAKTSHTYPLHMLGRYASTPPHLRSGITAQVAHEITQSPDQLPSFWPELACVDSTSEYLKPVSTIFKKELLPLLEKEACARDTFSLSEKQLVAVFAGLHSPVENKHMTILEPAKSIWAGLMQGTIHASMRGLSRETLKKRLDNGNIKMSEIQYTQDRIVHLLYTLTNGILKTQDAHLLMALHDLVSFRTPSLDYRSPHAGLHAAAGFSLNDDTLVKGILVDFTNSLLEAIYHPNSDEAGKNLEKTIEGSPVGRYYLHAAKKQDPTRDKELVAFYKERYGKLGQLQNPEMEIEEFYSSPLPFPENKIYSQKHDLWIEYLKLFSQYALDNNLMKFPLEIVHLPDGTVRHIALVTEDPFHAAHDTLRYFSQRNMEISNQHTIESFLTFMRPKLLGSTSLGLEINNRQKRENLINSPDHGLSSMGLTISIDQKGNPSIEAQSISIDQSASTIDMQINNTILHMRLNDVYELCALDGSPLALNEDTRIWWDHVILPQLHQYICVQPDLSEGYMEGVLPVGSESLPEATRRVITKRVGYFRKLGIKADGGEKHHTQEQRNAVLQRKYLLPKIEQLDLYDWNKKRPFGEKVTFVLPIEKELTERPVFHLPHAYKDDEAILSRDPALQINS